MLVEYRFDKDIGFHLTWLSGVGPFHQVGKTFFVHHLIEKEIIKISKRQILKRKRNDENTVKYREKFKKRTGKVARPSTVVTSKEKYRKENLHKHFDSVYCKKNASYLAKSIWKKVVAGTYKPTPAICVAIPKPGSKTKREITEFSIPDSALSNVIHRRIIDRNARNLSPMSYAYVPDRNVFDAILQLKQFSWQSDFFSVQIDFKRYFDSIPHKYLKSKLSQMTHFQITVHERYVIGKFMEHEYASKKEYFTKSFKKRNVGVPQGSSLSLFLANLANHDLDLELMNQPGRFVRFADDVVALCSTLSDARSIEQCFVQHCKKSGLEINKQKSKGIVKISAKRQNAQSSSYFDYLGYRFGFTGLTLPQKTVRRLKSRVSRLINIYLIHYIDGKEGGFRKARISGRRTLVDWDLLGLISELRWSIYGGLDEEDIADFIREGKKLKKVKGIMGFYCLLDDPTCLQNLDGWMVSRIRIAMRTRNQILKRRYGCSCPTPSPKLLISGKWFNKRSVGRDWRNVEVQMPSFVRGWKAARKHRLTYGLDNVTPPTRSSRVDAGKLIDSSRWKFLISYLSR